MRPLRAVDTLGMLPAIGRGRGHRCHHRHPRREAALAAHPGAASHGVSPAGTSPASTGPADLADAGTVGIIYDDTDGLNFYNDYGMLRDLFADPALAPDKRYSQALRGYLGSDSIGPLPFRRLAAPGRLGDRHPPCRARRPPVNARTPASMRAVCEMMRSHGVPP